MEVFHVSHCTLKCGFSSMYFGIRKTIQSFEHNYGKYIPNINLLGPSVNKNKCNIYKKTTTALLKCERCEIDK